MSGRNLRVTVRSDCCRRAVAGRYCVFGNLYARLGAEGEVFRLDRHPSMSRHPITPMDEADLRLHLSKQTRKKIGLLDVTQLDSLDPNDTSEIL